MLDEMVEKRPDAHVAVLLSSADDENNKGDALYVHYVDTDGAPKWIAEIYDGPFTIVFQATPDEPEDRKYALGLHRSDAVPIR